MKSLEIDHEAQERLKRTKNQQAEVVPPSPESPAEARDDRARYEGKENETKDVISVGYVAPADCPRGEEMAEQTSDKEEHTDPNPAAAPYVDNGHRA